MMKKYLIAAFLGLLSIAAIGAEITDLSGTASSNTARFPESQALSTVNDGARELEAIIARWAKDTSDTDLLSSGSSNAHTVSANRTISAYYQGLTVCYQNRVGSNTGAVTLNVDSVGTATIKKNNDQDLESGDFEENLLICTVYDDAADVWQLLTPTAAIGFVDPTTTEGDLIVRGSSSIGRLAIGASNAVLSSNGTTTVWNQIRDLLDSAFSSNPGDLLARTSTGWDTIANGVTGYQLTAQTSGTPIWSPSGSGISVALYQYQEATNTASETYVASDWRNVGVNVEVYDPDGIGSVADPAITLGAGTYVIDATALWMDTNAKGRVRIFNSTDSTSVAQGINIYTNDNTNSRAMPLNVYAAVSITESKTFTLQVYPTGTTDAIQPVNTGDAEVYATVRVIKLQ